jgi:hypothetical protein
MPVIAPIPGGWVIDWRDVARWLLEDLEREDPPRVSAPERDLRFGQRPWPASARRFSSHGLVSASSRACAATRKMTTPKAMKMRTTLSAEVRRRGLRAVAVVVPWPQVALWAGWCRT